MSNAIFCGMVAGMTFMSSVAWGQGIDVGGDVNIVNDTRSANTAVVFGDDSAALAGVSAVCGTVKVGGDLEISNQTRGANTAVTIGDRSHTAAGAVLVGNDGCY